MTIIKVRACLHSLKSYDYASLEQSDTDSDLLFFAQIWVTKRQRSEQRRTLTTPIVSIRSSWYLTFRILRTVLQSTCPHTVSTLTHAKPRWGTKHQNESSSSRVSLSSRILLWGMSSIYWSSWWVRRALFAWICTTILTNHLGRGFGCAPHETSCARHGWARANCGSSDSTVLWNCATYAWGMGGTLETLCGLDSSNQPPLTGRCREGIG